MKYFLHSTQVNEYVSRYGKEFVDEQCVIIDTIPEMEDMTCSNTSATCANQSWSLRP